MRYTVHNPYVIANIGLASCAFARHYSRNLVWFLFLSLLRCFSSGGSLYIPMYSVCSHYSSNSGVAPFGYLRIDTYLQLPAAFRSLSRPSSAPDAKAFTLCSCSLELLASVFWPLLFFELLEFHKTNNCYFGFSLQWKGFILFIFDWFTPPFRWNCNFYPNWKDH